MPDRPAQLCSLVLALLPLPLTAQGGGNGEPPLPPKAEESLEGPPLVNARAWAILDGKTGELVWGKAAETPRPMASTTKLMTALLVVELAAAREGLLEETVAVSEFAGSTRGSGAGLRPGDRLRVGELLSGLLLPSGNDAANALAEHCGQYLPPVAAAERIPPHRHAQGAAPTWERFVAAMNRRAQALGLAATRFCNPHGLDTPGHASSAKDLGKLAFVAEQQPGIRDRVRQRRISARIAQQDGRSRRVTWNNTNRLLGIQGYRGMKTGTTSKAGCCLVASGIRGEDALILVVLGSVSRGGRYVDARNLFRWAWRIRAAARQR